MGVDGINVMAGNFVSTDSQESKYSKARQIAAEARGQMANRQDSVLLAGMAACMAADPNGASMSRRVLEGQKAARRMQLDMRQNVAEKSQDNLDEIKKRLEEKTEEILNGSDERKAASESSVDEQGASASVTADATAKPAQGRTDGGARLIATTAFDTGGAESTAAVAAAASVAAPVEAAGTSATQAGALPGALDLTV
ncbi:MAG: hypothetical protein U0M13_11775 [Desulfovibrio fairfieldensis]|uniref:hypothetical protein n=1 Tax=Desulfovibrio sp. 3_1_syn3 TaxID=457398 RepID=UPI0001E12E58|nr:hypothetical protein [Desulfovibrio sp. 3_1_syn3]EFL84290.1 hypothetical protein HMPREF0326_03144 [Desulfovibrio sp. 3_1_syn3]MEE0816331.1 hypothetical protein [Desulfovibrio fairfieldensis]